MEARGERPMGNRNAVFVGCDLGDKQSEICVMDGVGAVIEAKRVRTTKPALVQALRKYGRAQVVVEAGTHSRWVEDALSSAGHQVVVANPRQIKLIWGSRKKTDRTDAMLLARLSRVDLTLLAPVNQRSHGAQVDLASLRSRDVLVSARTKLVNHVRGPLKQFGVEPRRAPRRGAREEGRDRHPRLRSLRERGGGPHARRPGRRSAAHGR